MTEELKKEIKQYIKDNMSINIHRDNRLVGGEYGYMRDTITISIYIEDDEICSSEVDID